MIISLIKTVWFLFCFQRIFAQPSSVTADESVVAFPAQYAPPNGVPHLKNCFGDFFQFQLNGNGEIYTKRNISVWSTSTDFVGSTMFFLQNGALEVKSNANTIIWTTPRRTGYLKPYTLTLKVDGLLYITDAQNQQLWKSQGAPQRLVTASCPSRSEPTPQQVPEVPMAPLPTPMPQYATKPPGTPLSSAFITPFPSPLPSVYVTPRPTPLPYVSIPGSPRTTTVSNASPTSSTSSSSSTKSKSPDLSSSTTIKNSRATVFFTPEMKLSSSSSSYILYIAIAAAVLCVLGTVIGVVLFLKNRSPSDDNPSPLYSVTPSNDSDDMYSKPPAPEFIYGNPHQSSSQYDEFPPESNYDSVPSTQSQY